MEQHEQVSTKTDLSESIYPNAKMHLNLGHQTAAIDTGMVTAAFYCFKIWLLIQVKSA